jgi:hypothetical protein
MARIVAVAVLVQCAYRKLIAHRAVTRQRKAVTLHLQKIQSDSRSAWAHATFRMANVIIAANNGRGGHPSMAAAVAQAQAQAAKETSQAKRRKGARFSVLEQPLEPAPPECLWAGNWKVGARIAHVQCIHSEGCTHVEVVAQFYKLRRTYCVLVRYEEWASRLGLGRWKALSQAERTGLGRSLCETLVDPDGQVHAAVTMLQSPFFSGFDEAVKLLAMSRMQPLKHDADEAVYETGDPADGMVFVLSGRVNVLYKGEMVGGLGVGEYFGQRALFTNAGRSARLGSGSGQSGARGAATEDEALDSEAASFVETAAVSLAHPQIVEDRLIDSPKMMRGKTGSLTKDGKKKKKKASLTGGDHDALVRPGQPLRDHAVLTAAKCSFFVLSAADWAAVVAETRAAASNAAAGGVSDDACGNLLRQIARLSEECSGAEAAMRNGGTPAVDHFPPPAGGQGGTASAFEFGGGGGTKSVQAVDGAERYHAQPDDTGMSIARCRSSPSGGGGMGMAGAQAPHQHQQHGDDGSDSPPPPTLLRRLSSRWVMATRKRISVEEMASPSQKKEMEISRLQSQLHSGDITFEGFKLQRTQLAKKQATDQQLGEGRSYSFGKMRLSDEELQVNGAQAPVGHAVAPVASATAVCAAR